MHCFVTGEAWNALVHGKKRYVEPRDLHCFRATWKLDRCCNRWLLYPPGHMNVNMHVEDFIGVENWLKYRYPKLKSTALAPIECAQNAGDVIYLPSNWLHAINNLMDSVGVTVDHLHPLVATHLFALNPNARCAG